MSRLRALRNQNIHVTGCTVTFASWPWSGTEATLLPRCAYIAFSKQPRNNMIFQTLRHKPGRKIPPPPPPGEGRGPRPSATGRSPTWQPSAALRKVSTVADTGAAPVTISLTFPPRLDLQGREKTQGEGQAAGTGGLLRDS